MVGIIGQRLFELVRAVILAVSETGSTIVCVESKTHAIKSETRRGGDVLELNR